MTDSVIRVVVADDHDLFRQGIKVLLEAEGDIAVVGEAATGDAVQQVVAETQPHVVLMDISMPVTDGLSATREILRTKPDTGVIILTMHDEEGLLFRALRAGARGYLLKTSRSSDVVAAVRAVSSGGSLMDPATTAKVLDEFSRLSEGPAATEGLGSLSEAEVGLLRLVAEGLSNKEIARKTSYAERTIKNRLSVVFAKINVRHRTQAAIYAIAHGVHTPRDGA
ncbi:MAG: response regulator transcription factor [Betaproteobacteria bacterium]|nr:response regulator transcription factor [Betaproteobacteria bacterium]